jgi:MarR family transcriptional regulator, organic hydroperoxide resistance regulator
MLVNVTTDTTARTAKGESPARRANGAPATSAGREGVAKEAWSLLQQVAFSERPRWMAVIREYDLVPPHWIALQTLEEPTPMGELAKRLACDNSNVTWITDRLEERGLVERRAAPHDRRVRLLALTDAGRGLRDEIAARLAEPPDAIAALSRDDLHALRDVLRRAAEHLD